MKAVLLFCLLAPLVFAYQHKNDLNEDENEEDLADLLRSRYRDEDFGDENEDNDNSDSNKTEEELLNESLEDPVAELLSATNSKNMPSQTVAPTTEAETKPPFVLTTATPKKKKVIRGRGKRRCYRFCIKSLQNKNSKPKCRTVCYPRIRSYLPYKLRKLMWKSLPPY